MVLHRGNGPEPDSLDPHRAQGVSAGNLLRDLYEGLVAEDAAGRLIPGLAQSWHTSADGLHWRVRLRPRLRWSDGSALLAEDFIASFRRAVDPATAAPYAAMLSAIDKAPEIIAGRLAPERLAVGAEGPWLLFRLQHPEPALPAILAQTIAFPVHRALREGRLGAGDPRLPVPGPFRLVERVPHSHARLAPNPWHHARGEIRLDQVVFHVTEDAFAELARFRAGELHLTETIPPGSYARLRAQWPEQLRVAPYLGSFWFGINLERAPLGQSLALREALSLAIDRDILVRHVTGAGEAPAWTATPPGLEGHGPPRPAWAQWPQSRREGWARQRLAESGLMPLRQPIEIRYNTHPLQRRTALAVAAMWQQVLGVACRLHNEEWRVFVANRRARRLTEVFRGGWIADLPDAGNFLELFRSDSPLNATGYQDPEFDRLLSTARWERDAAQRQRVYQAAEARMLAAHPILPLYHNVSRHMLHPALRGWIDNPLDRHPSRWLWLDSAAMAQPRRNSGTSQRAAEQA